MLKMQLPNGTMVTVFGPSATYWKHLPGQHLISGTHVVPVRFEPTQVEPGIEDGVFVFPQASAQAYEIHLSEFGAFVCFDNKIYKCMVQGPQIIVYS